MSVKVINRTINSRGYAGVAELNDDYVFLQPKGQELSEIIIFQFKAKDAGRVLPMISGLKNPDEIIIPWENAKTTRNKLLGKISKSMNLPGSSRLYSRKNFINYSKALNGYINKNHITNPAEASFELDFYSNYGNPRNTVKFLDINAGEIAVTSDLVYKYIDIKSPESDHIFSIFFQPSKYLDSDKNLWKLISILGEKVFKREINKNHSIVNASFITNAFKNSAQYYYINSDKTIAFSSTNERLENRYGVLSKLQLSTFLEYLDINQIETLIEKGEINI